MAKDRRPPGDQQVPTLPPDVRAAITRFLQSDIARAVRISKEQIRKLQAEGELPAFDPIQLPELEQFYGRERERLEREAEQNLKREAFERRVRELETQRRAHQRKGGRPFALSARDTVAAQIALEHEITINLRTELPKNAIEFVRKSLGSKAPSDDAIRDNIVNPVLHKPEGS